MRESQLADVFTQKKSPSGVTEERRRWALAQDAGVTRLCLLQCPGADEAYFIAKEILATERTHLKDLEVITVVSGLRPLLLCLPPCCLALPGGRRPLPKASPAPGADAPCSLNRVGSWARFSVKVGAWPREAAAPESCPPLRTLGGPPRAQLWRRPEPSSQRLWGSRRVSVVTPNSPAVVPQRGGHGGRHARGPARPALPQRRPHLRAARRLPARAGAAAGALVTAAPQGRAPLPRALGTWGRGGRETAPRPPRPAERGERGAGGLPV